MPYETSITDIAHEQAFIESFNRFQALAYSNSVNKGFWDTPENIDTSGNKIGLMHSELSEALEAMRHGNPPDDKIPEFSGAEAELADCIIRIFDLAGRRKYRIAEAIVAKMAYNTTRERLHGKKF